MSYQPPFQPPQPPYSWQPPVPEREEGTAWGAGGPQQPGPRRKRRVFLWVFLAVQVLFVIWVITAAAGGGSIHSEAVAYCHAHPDRFLSFAQCVSDYGGGAKVGAAIGAGLIVVFWAVVDVILGVSYGVWRLARR